MAASLRNTLFVALLLVFGVVAGLGGYYAGGRSDAIEDARPLARLAGQLIRHGQDGAGLGPGREALLLELEDAGVARGLARTHPAAVPVSLTRSLAERLASDQLNSGISQIRQAGYASGLETQLSKPQLIALWLETVEMGRGPHGWLRGLYEASEAIYDRAPAELSEDQFLRLTAVALAPARFHLDRPDTALDQRVMQMRKLIEERCRAPDKVAISNFDCGRT